MSTLESEVEVTSVKSVGVKLSQLGWGSDSVPRLARQASVSACAWSLQRQSQSSQDRDVVDTVTVNLKKT